MWSSCAFVRAITSRGLRLIRSAWTGVRNQQNDSSGIPECTSQIPLVQEIGDFCGRMVVQELPRGAADLLFGLEPVVEIRAWLAVSLEVCCPARPASDTAPRRD